MVKLLLALGTAPSQIRFIGFSLRVHLASSTVKAIPVIGRLKGKCILNISLCVLAVTGKKGNTRIFKHRQLFSRLYLEATKSSHREGIIIYN
jgi:hypothetical protein